MQRRSAQPGKYDISLPPTTTKSTTDNTALVCRGAKRKDSGVISNFILLITTLRLLLPKRREIMMAIDKGRAGILKDSIISPRDLNLNQHPKPGLAPYQWESPTSPDTSYTPWAADPPGILPSLSLLLLRARSAEAVHGRRSWISLRLLSARRAAAPGAAGHPQQHRLSPLSLHGHDSENMECVSLLLFGDRFFARSLFAFFSNCNLGCNFKPLNHPPPKKSKSPIIRLFSSSLQTFFPLPRCLISRG